ncbi:VWA domain-containing protein [bacterium]|nr:VWA domain-containing protein [bacterium]
MKNVIFGFCLLLISTPIGFTQEEVTVSSIHVWIAVEGSKASLTEKDFEIFEDGKRMTPTCFEKMNFAVPQEESTASSDNPSEVPAGKRIAIFIDELNTSPAELEFIKPKILEFLKQIAKSEVMLVAFPPYEPLVSFTKDIDEIKTKLEDLTGNRNRDMDKTEKRRRIELVLEYCCPRPIQKATDMALQYQMEETQEVQMFLESLKKFSGYLSQQNQDEHTVVLLISGGINSRPGQQYLDMVNRVAGNMESDLPIGDFGTTNFDIRKSIQKVLGQLNRDNLTIYTISTRGDVDTIDEIVHSDRKYAPKNQKGYAEDLKVPLAQIAHETGGLAFENSLNFKHGFDAILKDLNQQYLICYQAPEHDDEGEYHEIKVKSKVKGIKLRHREGYVD